MSEQELRGELDRASRADTARDVLREAMKALEEKCIYTFKASNPHDHEGHTMTNLYLLVLNDVEQRLLADIAGGDVAEKRLLKMPKPKFTKRRMLG